MVSFITLYRGASIATAELIAVSTDPDLVAHVAGALLLERQAVPSGDPAAGALARGRRRALRLLRTEASAESAREQTTRAATQHRPKPPIPAPRLSRRLP
jgi:hypothetical protein